MTTQIRSHWPGPLPEAPGHRPLYARTLRLKSLAPSGFLCFAFLEGSVALGILLALAELVSWWGVLVLPATVAVMVKLNDVVAGAVSQPAGPPPYVVASAMTVPASTVPGVGRVPIRHTTASQPYAALPPAGGAIPPGDVGLPPAGGVAPPAYVGLPPAEGIAPLGHVGLPHAGGVVPAGRADLPSAGGVVPAGRAGLPSAGGVVPPARAGLPLAGPDLPPTGVGRRSAGGDFHRGRGVPPASPGGGGFLEPHASPLSDDGDVPPASAGWLPGGDFSWPGGGRSSTDGDAPPVRADELSARGELSASEAPWRSRGAARHSGEPGEPQGGHSRATGGQVFSSNGPLGPSGPVGRSSAGPASPVGRSSAGPASPAGRSSPASSFPEGVGPAEVGDGVRQWTSAREWAPSAPIVDAGVLNGPPASGQGAQQLDTQQQRARQAATRRYE